MTGEDFLRIINCAFLPFLNDLGFSLNQPSISGRLYRASFDNEGHSVSVSFEPGVQSFFVLVFTRERGALSDFDDRLRTPRLQDLNNRYMRIVHKEERDANEVFFANIEAKDDDERALLQLAKELRIVLPKYLTGKA